MKLGLLVMDKLGQLAYSLARELVFSPLLIPPLPTLLMLLDQLDLLGIK
uniref:Uncharacterized protein n=1 Tax=Picea glauca TaxID=3330 RepID=A0A101M258_PICGL|nr:hypothetical protein ABT39_MTgene2724 [Picea glauca]